MRDAGTLTSTASRAAGCGAVYCAVTRMQNRRPFSAFGNLPSSRYRFA